MTTKPARSRWRTTLRGLLGHVFVSVVFSLAPLEFLGEGDGVGEGMCHS